MKVAHDGLSCASFREENSRSRFTCANLFSLAPENARHLRMYARPTLFATHFSASALALIFHSKIVRIRGKDK
jgi:hypothetical protein